MIKKSRKMLVIILFFLLALIPFASNFFVEKNDSVSIEVKQSKEDLGNIPGTDVEPEKKEYVFKTRDDYLLDHALHGDITKTTITGDGSQQDPYVINSTDDFWWASFHMNFNNKYVELACDIILNDETFDENGNPSGGDGVVYLWRSISSGQNLFFDGNGHEIKGLYKTESTVGGLFRGETRIGAIENLNMSNVYINGESYVSTFCVYINVIKNCTVRNANIYAKRRATGFCYSVIDLDNCVNYANVFVDEEYGAGLTIITREAATIKDCINYGNITSGDANGSNARIGGIITMIPDRETTIVDNCVNYGTIEGVGQQAAGIVAIVESTKEVTIINCKNKGEVKVTDYSVGGIIGYAGVEHLSITNCESVGRIHALKSTQGELIGQLKSLLHIKGAMVIVKGCIIASAQGLPLFATIGSFINLHMDQNFIEVQDKRTEYPNYYLVSSHCNEASSKIYIQNLRVKVLVDLSRFLLFPQYNFKVEDVIVHNVEIVSERSIASVDKGFVHLDQTSLREVEGIIVRIKNRTGYSKYYSGTDFSGFYQSLRTGDMSLIAFDSIGQFQNKVSEQTLISAGYIKY